MVTGGSGPTSIAIVKDAVWVGSQGDGTVSRIDPATDLVGATISVDPRRFLRLAAGEGRIWVAASVDKVVKVIDPAVHPVRQRSGRPLDWQDLPFPPAKWRDFGPDAGSRIACPGWH